MITNDRSPKTRSDLYSRMTQSDLHYRAMVWVFQIQDLFSPHSQEERLKKTLLKPGMTVVDWGCGPGRFTVPAARLVGPEGKVYALDIQPMALQIVRDKAARASLTNVEAILLDSYDTGLPASSVDLVLLLDTIHAISDRDALLRETHRLLKPEGHLFMDSGHLDLATAREIVESSGLFAVVAVEGNDMLLSPKAMAVNG